MGMTPEEHMQHMVIGKINQMGKDMKAAMKHYDAKNMLAMQQVTAVMETLNNRLTAIEHCQSVITDLGFILCVCKHNLGEHPEKGCIHDDCSCEIFQIGDQG